MRYYICRGCGIRGMRIIPIILLIALALSIFTPYYIVLSQEEYSVDGAILSEIFIDFLKSIQAGNLSQVEYKYRLVSNTTLPSDLRYIHLKTYDRLYRIAIEANTLNIELANAVSNSTPELISVLRSMAINLYSDRLSIGDILNEYTDSLRKYIPTGVAYYNKELKAAVESFLLYLDNLISRTSDVIKRIEMVYNINILAIDIGPVENIIPAGSTLSIPLTFRYSKTLFMNNTLVIDLNIGWSYIKRYTFNLTELINTTIDIILPDSRELDQHHLITREGYIPVYGVIYLETLYNNTWVIAGRSAFRFEVRVYKPSITIRVPSLSYYGEPINISIRSNLDSTVDASIYIDNTFYRNITIVPGLSYILISYYNISKGYHTIIFDIHGYGRYRPIRYSASLAVTGKPIKASIIYPHECIQPITSYRIYGELRDGESFENLMLRVYIDDKEVFSEPVDRSFNLDIPIPTTLFISKYHIRILYGPYDLHYDPYVLESDIIAINIVGVLLLSFVGLAGVFIGLSHEREIIFRAISTGLRELYEVARGRGRVGVKFRELILPRLVRSIAAELYWRLIYRFKDVFPEPYDYETLREYLGRASHNITMALRDGFRRLTLLVERDLYSRYRVDRSEVEEIVRRIRDELE